MRHFDVNLTKHVQDLYSENCKTQMKEILADLNKWRDPPCSWIERLSKDVDSLQIAKQGERNSYQNSSKNFFVTTDKQI